MHRVAAMANGSSRATKVCASLMSQRANDVKQAGDLLVVLGDLNSKPNADETVTVKSNMNWTDAYRLANFVVDANELTAHSFKGKIAGEHTDFKQVLNHRLRMRTLSAILFRAPILPTISRFRPRCVGDGIGLEERR